ncbi:MAG: hypothetical protein KGH69_00960 [Candidatus Micrarchaeota archaeon]|nr:hypothetical protein [Candidatus Micrarchaeota archaeon]
MLLLLGMALFAATLLYGRYALLFAAISIAMIAARHLGRKTIKDAEVLAYASEIRRAYNGSNLLSVLRNSGAQRPLPKAVKRMSDSARLGNTERMAGREPGNKNLSEMLELLWFGLKSGKDIGNDLELFERRLSKEMRRNNRIRSSIGGIEALIYVGLVVFVPIFSGIVVNILHSSSELLGQSARPMTYGFSLTMQGYVLIMLFITRYFSKATESLASIAGHVLPLAVFGSAMIQLSSQYLSYVV